MAFLDFSKAFDTVSGNLIIDNLYKNVQAMVKFRNVSTDFFKMDKGVKHGCVLSPVLFCIYIHQFTKFLNDHK